MSAAREWVLGRLRGSLARNKLPGAEAAAPPRSLLSPRGALVEAFTREVREVNGTVHGPMPEGQVAEIIVRLVLESGSREILSWAWNELPVPGLEKQLARAGIERAEVELPVEPEARKLRLARMEQAGVGLTGALAGLADTGTLVLASGTGRPRLAWLLPPLHVALLPVETVCPSMTSFFADRKTAVAGASHLAFVTGPSRTADIELTLTRGVHGPKELHVVLIGES